MTKDTIFFNIDITLVHKDRIKLKHTVTFSEVFNQLRKGIG